MCSPLLHYEASTKHEKVNVNVSGLGGTESFLAAHIVTGQLVSVLELVSFQISSRQTTKLSLFAAIQPLKTITILD